MSIVPKEKTCVIRRHSQVYGSDTERLDDTEEGKCYGTSSCSQSQRLLDLHIHGVCSYDALVGKRPTIRKDVD